MPLLEVRNLKVRFHTGDGDLYAVNDLSFDLEQGRTLGIVGESGSGKSQLVLAIMNLLAANGSLEGSVRFRGQELMGSACWMRYRSPMRPTASVAILTNSPAACASA